MGSAIKQRIQALVTVLFVTLVAYAKVEGPDAGYTGAPGDIGTCVDCHDTYHSVNVGPGSVQVTDLPAVYTPGQQYTIKVTTQQSGRIRFGFQLTAITLAGSRAGTLTALDGNSQVHSDTGVGGRQYIEHTELGTLAPITGSRTWQMRWTTPATDVGPVRFFVAGNAANNSGDNQGDYIYTNAAVSDSETSAVTVDFDSQIGGITIDAGAVFKIDWSTTGASNIDNIELRYSTDDGMTFPITNLIYFTTDPAASSYDWTVPNTPTNEARVRIRVGKKSGDAVEAISGAFTITGSGGGPPPPAIFGASQNGKKLFVSGENFRMGAVVEMDGAKQKTKNEDDFSHLLKCKKAGKKIDRGQTVTLVVRNPDGIRSAPFEYTRPVN